MANKSDRTKRVIDALRKCLENELDTLHKSGLKDIFWAEGYINIRNAAIAAINAMEGERHAV